MNYCLPYCILILKINNRLLSSCSLSSLHFNPFVYVQKERALSRPIDGAVGGNTKGLFPNYFDHIDGASSQLQLSYIREVPRASTINISSLYNVAALSTLTFSLRRDGCHRQRRLIDSSLLPLVTHRQTARRANTADLVNIIPNILFVFPVDI